MADSDYFVIIIILIVLIFVFSNFRMENYDSAQMYGSGSPPLQYINFGTGEYEVVPTNGYRWT